MGNRSHSDDESQYLLSTYCVPGAVLGLLTCICSLNPQNSPVKEMILLSPFYKGETWEQSEMTYLSDTMELGLDLRYLAPKPVPSVAVVALPDV